MKVKTYLGCFFISLAVVCHFFQGTDGVAEEVYPADVEAFVQSIQHSAEGVRTFSSDFVQVKELALFSQPVVFNGKLTVVRPERLRWEFSSPVASVLIFSGKEGMRCDENGDATRFDLSTDPVMRTVAEQLWLWLGGDYSRLRGQYRMEKLGESTLVVLPQEKHIREYIDRVEISFSAIDGQPEKVDIIEPGGDATRIAFSGYRLNEEVDDTLFDRCDIDG